LPDGEGSLAAYLRNIWSDKKQNEEIDDIHNNPVVRGLAAHPGDWPWSSWRFYHREDRSLLAMDGLNRARSGSQRDALCRIHKNQSMRHPRHLVDHPFSFS
jgi:hypothetical protein